MRNSEMYWYANFSVNQGQISNNGPYLFYTKSEAKRTIVKIGVGNTPRGGKVYVEVGCFGHPRVLNGIKWSRLIRARSVRRLQEGGVK